MCTDNNVTFDLIYKAGNAKAYALMSIESSREYDFDKAKSLLENAEEELRLAHKVQYELIQKVASGEEVVVDVLLVHAQDHLTMAMLTIENAKEFLHLYKLIKGKEGK